jgi:hypothetical protein
LEGGAVAMQQAAPAQPQGNGDKGPSPGKSTSRTITDTIVGECQTGTKWGLKLAGNYFFVYYSGMFQMGAALCSSLQHILLHFPNSAYTS